MHPKTAEEGCPALPPQQGMIFNGLRVPDAGVDVVQCVIRWPGLDVTAYRAAWERAVTRHPVLRTGFVLAGDAEPVQVERPGATLDFAVRTDPEADFLVEDRARGFAFDTPPLVRVTALSHTTPIVVITLHHTVLDGRSLAMLMTELDSDYEGRPDFPERTDYRDFVEWYAQRSGRAREPARQVHPHQRGNRCTETACRQRERHAEHRGARRVGTGARHTRAHRRRRPRDHAVGAARFGAGRGRHHRHAARDDPHACAHREVAVGRRMAAGDPARCGGGPRSPAGAARRHPAVRGCIEPAVQPSAVRAAGPARECSVVHLGRCRALSAGFAGELWLTDAAGARYTAEFRFVAVDRRGPAPEGQS